MKRTSKIRPLRRALIRLAMWGDPEQMMRSYPDGARDCLERAKKGSIEAEDMLIRGWACLKYLRGERYD